MLAREGRGHLAKACFDFLPARAELDLAGWEADDIIATLAEKAKGEGHDVVIVTGDRDSYQLVEDPHVRVLYNKRGVSDYALYDEAGILERTGVTPRLYPEYAALRGDPSDNLPGVPGVGEKTAAKLITTYGGLDGIFENVAAQTPKLRESLTANEAQARMNHELMLLRRDAPVDVDVRHAGIKPDMAEVKRLFEHARDGNYDAVYTYYAEKKHAAWRNLGSRFTNWCADHLIDKPKGLYLSSFRCLSAFVREQITATYDGPYPYVDGLLFQVTQNVGRLQVAHLPRIEGRSNYTLARLFRLWLSMFLNFSVIPLRAATLLGLAFGAVGAIGAVLTIAEAIYDHRLPQGWASLMVAVLVLAGVQLVLVGVIGEYLGRLFHEVKGRPIYVVEGIYEEGQGRPSQP